MPRSATPAPLVTVELRPTADTTVRAGTLSGTAAGAHPSLTVRTAPREGQHKTSVALLRCAAIVYLRFPVALDRVQE